MSGAGGRWGSRREIRHHAYTNLAYWAAELMEDSMPQVISVRPSAANWLVESGSFHQPLKFSSGGKAEQAARRIGEQCASAGRETEVRVYLRDGSFGGRFVYAPTENRAFAR